MRGAPAILAAGHLSAALLSGGGRTRHTSLACAGGIDLLKHLNCGHDVIVCDLQLTDMTAMQVMEAVRKQHPNITFVVCVEPENLKEALLATMGGASGFVTTRQTSGAVFRQLRAAQIRQNLDSALAKKLSHKTEIRIAPLLAIAPPIIHRKGVHSAQVLRTTIPN